LLVRELLDERPPPTAIFAHNNVLAESVLKVLRERRLSVPDDVAVIGFDDPPWAPLLSPPLTVIRQPAYTIGATAAELLVRRLTNPSVEPAPTNVVLTPTLVVRGSCGGTPSPEGAS
jgi:DNA-binding LacI/PurR family transcriptional regulator